MSDTTTKYGLCDGYNVYCDAPATGKFKGEEDSFGVEWMYLCDACSDFMIADEVKEEKERQEQAKKMACTKCRKQDGTVQWWHIPDEPTYESDVAWCRTCRDKCRQDLDEEMCGYDMDRANRRGTEHKCYCGLGYHDVEARKVCQAPKSIGGDNHFTEYEARVVLWDVKEQDRLHDECEYVMCEWCAERYVDRTYKRT